MTYYIKDGYDAANITLLNNKYKCQICKLILRNPVQVACIHRICYSCVHVNNELFQCSECSEVTSLSKKIIDEDLNNEMQNLHIICNLCEWSGDFKNYQDHLEQVHHEYRCSSCNIAFNSLTLLDQHKETMCPEAMTNCPLQPYGCSETVSRRNLSKHYRTEKHQHFLLVIILQLLSNLTGKKTKHMQFDTLTEPTVDDLASQAKSTSLTTLNIDEHNIQQEYIVEAVNALSSCILTLNDDMYQLSVASLQQSHAMEIASQNLETVKVSCEQSNAMLNTISMNTSILEQDMSSLKHKVEESQSISYDGMLMWKIMNVQEKMNDAQSERQLSIYSPPFYSSPTGYKMCARLYFYGDGNARRTHMSIFFVLMRTEHDALLQFPFSYKVIFCLFDQTGEQQHIIDAFRPDTKSASFQKPRFDMNIASGIPRFVSLDKIEQQPSRYIKNDTMFIKVMVDFQNLPKTIIPYVVTLNPGLPQHCQQRMIQQETQRQAQIQSQQSFENESYKNNTTIIDG